jgi:murein DD-endopeptidase MepM/ murein hydrolase activator NlpD
MTATNSYPLLIAKMESGKATELDDITDVNLIKELQSLLNEKGFNSGAVDGIIGSQTEKAFEKAKDYLSLQYPKILGSFTIEKLLEVPKISAFFLPTRSVGVISSQFGYRIHPISGARRLHRGVDIASTRGTFIYAVADGIVNSVVVNCREGNRSCGGGFGNFVRITHPTLREFSESVYAHLEEVFVNQNESVSAGDRIGTMGNTGSSTGPHLHFETWKSGRAFNPLDVMAIV